MIVMPREKITLTKEQIKDAQENGGSTYKEQAEYLGVSEDVYRRERNIAEGKLYDDKIKCITERDPKLEIEKKLDITHFRESCVDVYHKSKKTIGYNEIFIDLGDDDACIKLDCDWHIGNEMTNLDLWSKDIETTIKTKRLFTVLDGDYTDNLDAIKKSGTYESILSVPEAKQKVANAVAMMGNKILGVVQGCHDEWFFNQDSWHISQYLADHTE